MTDTDELAGVLHEWIHVFMRSSMSSLVRFTRGCGLSMSQAGVLFRLSHHGITSGVSDIGDDLGVTSAAASQLLDRLVHQGLIVRSEDPQDRRAKRFALTEQGRSVIEEATNGRRRWFATLAEQMSPEERATVLSGLKILIQKIGEAESSNHSPAEPVAAKEHIQE